MLGVIKPDFEVVKEGWILHSFLGYRNFEAVIDNRVTNLNSG